MKTFFDKPNEQCQARLSIAVARKRGLKAKVFLFGAMVCALGMMTGCRNGGATEGSDDTTVDTEPVNQYDDQGRKTGYWSYDVPGGWRAEENYTDGILDGKAVYSEEKFRIEVNYCNGDECGEVKFFFEDKLDLHITDITKVDTMINGYLIHYRGYFKEYFDDGTTVRCEGMGFYADHNNLLAEGYYMIGRWLRNDNPAHFTPDTVMYTVPTIR